MRRSIPSTWALQAFEASARHQSFTKAAQELALTQSAICRQIGALEEFLGVRLFIRSKRGMRLTEAGAAYQRQIPDSELVIVPIDGYHSGGSAPDACALATRAFLDRRGPAT